MSKFRRMLSMAQRGGEKLPYKRLAYIQAVDGAYINTGITPQQITSIEVKDFTPLLADTYGCVLGCSQAGNRFYMPFWYGDRFDTAIGNFVGYTTPYSINSINNLSANWETGNLITSLNGEEKTSTLTARNGLNIYIFAYNIDGNVGRQFNGRAREVCFGQLTTFEAVQLTEDVTGGVKGENGMWDIVNKKFHGNVGTGKFIAGPELVQLPAGYKQTYYTKSTGGAYITCPYPANIDTTFEVKYRNSLSFDASVFGQNGGFRFWLRPANYTSSYWMFGNQYVQYPNIPSSGHFKNEKGNLINIETGVTVANLVSTIDGYDNTNKFTIFRASQGTTPHNINEGLEIDFFILKENETVIWNLVSCINPQGEAGMYDIVKNKFHGNEHTSGEFIAGEII